MVSFFRYIISLTLIVLPLLTSCRADNSRLNSRFKGVNVVLVLTDDQGWGDVGFHGNVTIETGVIDSIAQQGVVFDRFYVSPVCAPTRASILTGRYHLTTGTSWVTHRKEVMRNNEVTLAEILQSEGYETGCFGKWHNGAQYPHNPNGQGFKTFFGFSSGHWNNYFDTKLEYNGEMVQTKGYLPDVLTDSAIAFIKKNENRPFFAYVAYNTPHTPYQVGDHYFDKYKSKGLDDKTACIYGMCENIDDNIKRIIDQLEESKLSSNTIFIFMSDNGPNYERYNGNFKGRKAQVDEGGVRVPFVIRYPNGNFNIVDVNNEMAAHIDLLPTILDLCNISLPDSLNIDGVSLKPLLTNQTNSVPDRKFYTHHVIREFDTFPGAIRTNKHLLTVTPWDTALYDLHTDPYQKVNIADRAPSTVDQYINDYKVWFRNVTAQGIKPEAIHLNNTGSKKTILPAHEAALSKGISFFGGDGWANDWCVGNGCLTWDINVLEAGDYAVTALYSNNNTTSNLKVYTQNNSTNKVLDFEANAPVLNCPDRVERVEVPEKKWSKVKIGNLFLSEENKTISLAIDGNELNGQTEIKSIIITKI